MPVVFHWKHIHFTHSSERQLSVTAELSSGNVNPALIKPQHFQKPVGNFRFQSQHPELFHVLLVELIALKTCWVLFSYSLLFFFLSQRRAPPPTRIPPSLPSSLRPPKLQRTKPPTHTSVSSYTTEVGVDAIIDRLSANVLFCCRCTDKDCGMSLSRRYCEVHDRTVLNRSQILC